MYQFRKDQFSPTTRPGSRLPCSNASAASPLAHVGQTTILAGMLAMDATAGFAIPLLAAIALSAQPDRCLPVILLTSLLALCLIGLAGGYSLRLLHRPAGQQIRLVLTSGMAAIGGTALAAWAFDGGRMVNAGWALPAIGLGLLGLAGGRAVIGWTLTRDPAGAWAPRTIVVGGGPAGMRLMRSLLDTQTQSNGAESMGERGRLLGYIDDLPAATHSDARFLGGLTELLALIRKNAVDRVIIALPWSAQAPVLDLIRQLAECPVQIELARDAFDPDQARQDQARPELIHLMDPPLSGLAGLVKRGEDIALASVLLIPSLPVMAAIALLIRLDSAGPVLFRQRRTGFNNRDFRMLKFRTMHHHLTDHDAARQVTHRDPRVTRIGAWLRRSSLDELPQLFNVLRGDMSIVGPRPHAPGTQAGGRVFDQVVTHYAARHRVRPGVTGLAQVRGLRGPTETEDKLVRRVDSDLEYIENWSVWLDLLVLARTAFAVLRMKNAC
jgi:Undecaprenyl-phosphate glucose phosphotransferase